MSEKISKSWDERKRIYLAHIQKLEVEIDRAERKVEKPKPDGLGRIFV